MICSRTIVLGIWKANSKETFRQISSGDGSGTGIVRQEGGVDEDISTPKSLNITSRKINFTGGSNIDTRRIFTDKSAENTAAEVKQGNLVGIDNDRAAIGIDDGVVEVNFTY